MKQLESQEGNREEETWEKKLSACLRSVRVNVATAATQPLGVEHFYSLSPAGPSLVMRDSEWWEGAEEEMEVKDSS